ncbi:MAG: hypothetical protein BWY06_03528 [Candidatus Latescibacteria bacterium ADurb.Bin168]|nr:MAG: hypothetical protein BWY06_03528 [Candidatus Latescibacteria bacterium ADurb.Bin168]
MATAASSSDRTGGCRGFPAITQRATPRVIPLNSHTNGHRIELKAITGRITTRLVDSEWLFPSCFGNISPKIRITVVMRAVLTQTAVSGSAM